MTDSVVAFEIKAVCPGAPGIVSADPGNGQVELTWNIPEFGGCPISGYEIWYKAFDAEDWIRFCMVTDTNETVTGLLNGQMCAFRLAAVNAAGVGPMSSEIVSVPRTVPGVPAVFATAGNCCVGLEWSVEDNGGAEIIEYVIYLGTEEVARTTDVFHSVADLMNGNPYSFQVAAVNAAGEGPKSVELIMAPLSDSDILVTVLQALVANMVFLVSIVMIHASRLKRL